MKKEPLSIMTVKTLLAVVIFVGIGTIIISGGYLIGDYYKNKVDNKVVKQIPEKEFCTDNILEDCDGKKVNITGTLEYIPKGPIPILTNLENREAKYTWAGGVFLIWPKSKIPNMIEGVTVNVIGKVSIGGQPCSTPEQPRQCMSPYNATEIKVESIEIIKQAKKVAITTDKTEYEQGETVEITVKNNLDKSIFFRGLGQPCFNSFSIGINREGYKMFYDIGTAYCVTDITELKPNIEQVFHLETGDIDDTLSILNTLIIYPEIYKLKLNYGFDSESLTNIIYSNEFTIKEKSVLDPRCSEKVKDLSGVNDIDCAVILFGYEYDSVMEKCVTKAVDGCSVETPFNSLEECQEVCEKKENVVLPDEDELIKCGDDNDCALVNSGCCGCSMGGGMTCINKKYLENWNRRLSCQDEINRMCPAVYLCDTNPTGCECVNNVCQGTGGDLTKL